MPEKSDDHYGAESRVIGFGLQTFTNDYHGVNRALTHGSSSTSISDLGREYVRLSQTNGRAEKPVGVD